MAVLQYRTLSNRTVATLSVERDTVFWDRELTGFGVRVYPSGGKVFVAQARGPDGPDKPNKPRRITVGRHPVLSAEQARQRAALIIARVKAGEDPVPLPLPAKYAGGPTVTDLANRYLEEHVAVRCKPKTQRTARSVVNRHIVPALGKLPIAAVQRRHVMALHESLCETPAMANMAVETLSHMYGLARGWDMAPEDCDDPCEFIPMNPKRKRERFLTDAEFTRLGHVLDEVSGKGSRISAGAIATIRLLMLTGCRRNEILTLRWEHVDLDKAEIHLADGKTGARTIHLSPSAVRVLTDLPRKPGNPWVIPGAKPGTHMTDIDGAWETIARGRNCTTCASMTSDTASPRERSRSARACRSSAGCSVTAGWRPPRATHISRATRSGNPPNASPSASLTISCRRKCRCATCHARIQ